MPEGKSGLVAAGVVAALIALVVFAVSEFHGSSTSRHPVSQSTDLQVQLPVIQASGGGSPTASPTSAPPSTPAGTDTATATGTGIPDPTDTFASPVPLDPVTSSKIVSTSTAFTQAYLGRSYRDSSPTAWAARCQSDVTSSLESTMQSQAASEDTDWSAFVSAHGQVTVSAIQVTQPAASGDDVYTGVSYTQTTTEDGQAPTSYPGYLTLHFVNVQGTWLVDSIGTQSPATAGN